jgi:hypothetical protein
LPVFKNFADLEIVRGIRAFLNLEAGIVRGEAPEESDLTTQLAEKDRRIERLQRWLEGKDRNLDRLRREVSDLRVAARGAQKVPIFFVLGRQKSGTTWLMRLLNQHPEILCRGEGKFFGRHARDERVEEFLKGCKDLSNLPGTVPPPVPLYGALANDEYLRYWTHLSFWTRQGDAEEYLKRFTRLVVTEVLTEKLAGTNKRMVGDKTPIHDNEVVREIAEILPEAKVVHIIRDGRDVAVSQMHHIWNRTRPAREGGGLTPEEEFKRDRYREDPEKFLASGESIFTEERLTAAAREWNEKVGATRKLGPEVLRERYLEVRYEQMLQSPEEEAAKVFGFLEGADDPQLVRRCVEEASFERIAGGRKRGEEDSESPLRKGVAGDWKNVFTQRDRQIYEGIAGDLLSELRYERTP